MNRKEKSEKKRIISEYIDLGNGRYKDSEVDSLHELATEPDKYNGKSKTIRKKFDGVSSDGKYTREEETTYTLRGDKEGVRIEKKYQYHDDDGQTGGNETVYKTGRDILNLFKSFLND